MSVKVIRDAQVFLGGREYTGDLNAAALNYAAEMLDNTRLGDNTRIKVGGLKNVTCAVEGMVDNTSNASHMFDKVGASAEAMTLGADGAAAADLAYMFKASSATYNPNGSVGELLKFSLDAEATDSDLIRGNVLHNAVAETVSGSSTPQNLGAVSSAQQLYATLHALAVSTGDTLDIIIESDIDAAFLSPATVATFAQVSAESGEWLTPVAGPITDTWYRISWTIAGAAPSFDFVVSMGIQ